MLLVDFTDFTTLIGLILKGTIEDHAMCKWIASCVDIERERERERESRNQQSAINLIVLCLVCFEVFDLDDDGVISPHDIFLGFAMNFNEIFPGKRELAFNLRSCRNTNRSLFVCLFGC